ncbi:MAG TPA: sulfotransferase [Propionibacteriaceae bacterium]
MSLATLRAEIDVLDEALVRTLARRFAVCRDVAEFKARTATPMMQPQRVTLVKQRAAARAHRYGLPEEFVAHLYDAMVAAICAMEDELIAALASAPQAAPVFVGGEDRSGTTLVSVVLDAHRDLVVGPELDYLLPVDLGPHLRECCRLLKADDPRVAGVGVHTADPAYAAGVQLARQADRFGVDHARLDELVAATMRRTGSDLVTHDQRLALIEAMGRVRCADSGKRRWGVKIQRGISQPQALVDRWPEAKFVHVVRDGRDVAASHLRGQRDWGYRSAAEAATGWVEVVTAVRGALSYDHLHEIHYEDLVAQPERELRRLMAFLDLPWDPAVLHHSEVGHALFRHPHGHPSAQAAQQPINGGAVGRFRRDLSPVERAEFETIAGELLHQYGYEEVDR